MKNFFLLVFSILTFMSLLNYGQNVDLLGSLNPHPNLGYTDIWGYAANGREYALMGITGGTSIIDVTDPSNPVEVDVIPGPLAPPYEWRDIKTHLNYAYVISEGSGPGSGLQVVDLSFLPDSASLVFTFNNTFTSAHNVFIADGYAYVVGTSLGGMHIIDLTVPSNPVQTAYYSTSGYIHDVYVWNDTAYVSSANTYDIVDVSNKFSPQLVSASAALPGIYAHSGWLTEDKRYFVACEEFNVRDIIIWDLQDRSTWDLVVPSWQMSGTSPVHNIFVLGDYAHISYYKDGYVVLDISNPENPLFAGQYDTYPSSGGGTYNGAWGVYPYLPSGNIIISDMVTGLYVCKFNPPVTSIVGDNKIPDNFILEQNYPNPFNPDTKIKFQINENSFITLKVYDILGNEVTSLVNEEKPEGIYEVTFNADNLPSGIYLARLTGGSKTSIIKMSLLK
ncbi:MAG: choice-of-anchor B family protein [Ignavibacteriaceae bacterium]